MRVLICGGREYHNKYFFYKFMDAFHGRWPVTVVIQGAARGADSLAGEWANDSCVPQEVYPANWSEEGRRAGFIRNQRMLDDGRPDLCIAFPGGNGTADMIRRCEKHGVKVIRLDR